LWLCLQSMNKFSCIFLCISIRQLDNFCAFCLRSLMKHINLFMEPLSFVSFLKWCCGLCLCSCFKGHYVRNCSFKVMSVSLYFTAKNCLFKSGTSMLHFLSQNYSIDGCLKWCHLHILLSAKLFVLFRSLVPFGTCFP
jgi:hypothetical protein